MKCGRKSGACAGSAFRALRLVCLLLLALALPAGPTRATEPPDALAQRQAEIEQEAKAIEQAEARLKARKAEIDKTLSGLPQATVTEADVEKARTEMEADEVEAASVRIELVSTSRRIASLKDRLAQTEAQLARLQANGSADPKTLDSLRRSLDHQRKRLALEQQHLEHLRRRLELAQRRIALSRRLWSALQSAYQARQTLQHKASLTELQQRLQEAQQEAERKAAALRAKMDRIAGDDLNAVARRHVLMAQIEQVMGRVFLLRLRVALEQARTELQGLALSRPDPSADPKDLQASIRQIANIEGAMAPLVDVLKRKQALIEQELGLLRSNPDLQRAAGSDYRDAVDALQSTLDQLRAIQEQITGFIAQLHQRQAEFEQAYKTATARSLTARERLPASREGWARLGAELRALPHTAVGMARTVVGDLRAAWAGADLERRLLLVALELGWLALLGALARIPAQRGVPLRPDVSFSAKTRIVTLALLKRLPWTLLPAGALLLAAYVLRLPAKDLELLTVLALVAVGLQLVVGLSRWLFVSDLVSEERRDRGLHRRIVGVASVMAVLLVLADLGHLGYISRTLWGLVERAFMGLQLPLVPVALRLRGRLMEELEQTWGMTFWTRMLGLVSLSVPITIVATGLVGLSGYINLAWFVTGKLVLLLGILLVWAALRHLFMDWTEHLRERAQRYPKRAPLIVTGVIDPLEFTGRLGLFFAAVYAAGSALGWSTGTGVGAVLRDWLTRPLFHLGSAQVNALHLVGALVYITVLVYFGLWVRRLARDWLYAQVRDRGLRNSLAIFTQYAVLVLGVLVGLNLLDINLTSLAVFAGALGVGMGFGLQNIANNFVSGLILLLERPVRVEDWVTIDDKEGAITRIGMRSLTLTTWDNQDVIIPNANLISNPFTNWTLSDKLVRTVFVVGIRYQDDPHKAQSVIKDAVTMQPEVSLEREPRVLLTEFNASSVDFRVEYYVDVEQFSRLAVKSKVMFAIWDALKEADIGIPFPQRDIYIKELPSMGSSGQRADETVSPPTRSQAG